MIRRVLIWSVHERLGRKPACSMRRRGSTAADNLSKIILQKTLEGAESKVIPLQLLHWLRSPFLGTVIRRPLFQSSGSFSLAQIFPIKGVSVSTVVARSAFNISAAIKTSPGALPVLRPMGQVGRWFDIDV
ncbi:unnamed protein product [Pieris brassicae]|uniref:Uncharacterized protein n=1 Tax=Pieris brassicae TaxID=7116 RepID=A0A9P0TG51_PIEBR|nr:unnamed protein product [Pieris brassicae]